MLEPGESLLLYSDGLVEAHDPGGEMFGFPRLRELMGLSPASTSPVDGLLAELDRFTGSAWEQEDDITLVALERAPQPVDLREAETARCLPRSSWRACPATSGRPWKRVTTAVARLAVPATTLERLRTAVSEAAMNAIEHGNDSRPELPVAIEVLADGERLRVRITDGGGARPMVEPERPDLEAKLEGRAEATRLGPVPDRAHG